MAAALTAVVRDIVGNDASIPGLLLHVEAPNQGVDVSVAAGLDDRAAATSLAPDAGIRIASNAAEQAGMGIFRHDLAGAACWGHAGFWGTVVLTCPAVDVTVASSILQEIPAPGYNEDEVLVRAFEVGTEG